MIIEILHRIILILLYVSAAVGVGTLLVLLSGDKVSRRGIGILIILLTIMAWGTLRASKRAAPIPREPPYKIEFVQEYGIHGMIYLESDDLVTTILTIEDLPVILQYTLRHLGTPVLNVVGCSSDKLVPMLDENYMVTE